jgi:hypothetical protein
LHWQNATIVPSVYDASPPPGNEDALGLFGAEPDVTSASTPASPANAGVSTASAPVALPLADTPPNSNDAISVESILAGAPLRFVDGIALVQAVCASVKAKSGTNARMPALNGVLLAASGDVVTFSPPTGQPAAQELARLLHRLVPAEATPPMGRLFVDRWANGDSADLAQFESELAYFARPNGRELLAAVHARSVGAVAPSADLPTPPLPTTPTKARVRIPADNETPEERPARKQSAWVLWLQSHRRQLTAAALVVITSVALTAVATWFWPPKTAEAAQLKGQAGVPPDDEVANAPEVAPVKTATGSASRKALGQRGGRPPAAPPRRLESQRAEGPPATAPAVSGLVSGTALVEGPTANVPASLAPDTRIYSAADSGVEPPKLLSAEIVEGLITSFPTRTNSVEAIINERGEVERVRMLGPPQRIPDVMLLSRMKEWLFEPASKAGSAVRYRLVLSWNVTP